MTWHSDGVGVDVLVCSLVSFVGCSFGTFLPSLSLFSFDSLSMQLFLLGGLFMHDWVMVVESCYAVPAIIIISLNP